MPELRGTVSSLATPFAPDQRPDVAALGDLIEFQIERGIDAIFALGTVGEGVLMGLDERMNVAETVLDLVHGRVPAIVHCGAADTQSSILLGRHAAGLGAAAVAIVAPYFYRYEKLALERHFRSIAEAVPHVAVYIYDNPERVGYSIGVEVVRDLVGQVSNIRGVKDTGDSVAGSRPISRMSRRASRYSCGTTSSFSRPSWWALEGQ